MIYIKLIIDFFMVGVLSFGGAYAAIPLIKDVASHYDVISDELLMDFIAISESTPGPVAVNLATFVGTEVAGIPGAIVATLAEILPAFIIILIFTICFIHMLQNKNVSYALSIIRPCIVGLIMAVGLSLFIGNVLSCINDNRIYIFKFSIIAILIILTMLIYKKLLNKKLSAIKIIILGAFLGIAINYLL